MAQKVDVRYVSFYTGGSAAKKIAPVQPLKTIKLPRIKKFKRITLHIDPVATAGIVMAAVLMILLCVGVTQLQSARRETVQLAAYVDTLQTENAALRAEFDAGYDLETVEKTALALGMVPMDEVQHITIDMPQVQMEQPEPGTWQRVWTFLTGLFA